MKHSKRIISLLILVCMVLCTLLPALASGSSSSTPGPAGGSVGNASSGFVGTYGTRIGLGQCDNEVLDCFSGDEKSEVVQRYAAKYYTPIKGSWAYLWKNGSANENLTDYLGRQGKPAEGVLNAILTSVMTGNTNNDYVLNDGGRYYIKPDAGTINAVMDALKALGGNDTLYNHWVEEQTSLEAAAHPVIIVLETVALVEGDGEKYAMSADDMCARIGGAAARDRFVTEPISDLVNGVPDVGGNASATCRAIASVCGIDLTSGIVNGDDWPYRATKRFFGVNMAQSPRFHDDTHSDDWGYSTWARTNWQTNSDQLTGINGVTCVAIGGVCPTGMSGVYDWHIDATGLAPNPVYREDNISDYTHTKYIGVGAIDIKQSNIVAWNTWIKTNSNGGSDLFTLHINKYYCAGGDFTLDYEAVKENRRSSTNKLTSGVDSVDIAVKADELYKAIVNGSDYPINGLKGSSKAADVLGGSPLGESRYQVAYATTVTVEAPNGASVDLYNKTVHYAVYGDDGETTYIYNQIPLQGSSQIKQGWLDSEKYEAMSGTPTTEDLFVTQGGEQYIVQMQYRYVDEDYVRTYTLTDANGGKYPNFLYYDAGPTSTSGAGWSGSPDNSPSSTYKTDSYTFKNETNVYKAAAKTSYTNMYNNLKTTLDNWAIKNNYGADRDFYKGDPGYDICSPDTDTMVANTGIKYVRDWVNNTLTKPADFTTAFTGDEITATLFEATDLDSAYKGKVTMKVKVTGSYSCTQSKSGTHVCSADNGCYKTGTTEYVSGHDTTVNNTYTYVDKASWSYNWTITITYSDAAMRTKEFLGYTNTLEQQFNNVRYLDILEANLYRLVGGRQQFVNDLLMDESGTIEFLEMAVQKMGYTLYNSKQSASRSWDGGEKKWYAERISDLEKTGRLVNSYNRTNVKFDLPDHSTVTIVSDDDVFECTYDMSQGGRSHKSYLAYFARCAGYMFYADNTGANPYRNTIYISSDIFNINTGGVGEHGLEWFCYNDIDTERAIDMDGMEQYLMNPSMNTWVSMRKETFKKNDHSDITLGVHSKEDFANSAYNGGVVELTRLGEEGAPYAEKYDKEYIAEDNPYTFVDEIPEQGGITWVGYRGDTMTYQEDHNPVLSCTTEEPESGATMYAVKGTEYHGKAFHGGKVYEDKSVVGSQNAEFPNAQGLNVPRSLPNAEYPSGYAALYYEHALKLDDTKISSLVYNIMPSYDKAKIDIQGDLGSTAFTSSGLSGYNVTELTAMRATYMSGQETPNNVVIFNPSAAENAGIIPQPDTIPDAAGNNNSAYPRRDQRVAIGVFSSNGTTEPVVTTPGTYQETVTHPAQYYEKKLRDSSLAHTSYYTWNDDYEGRIDNEGPPINLIEGYSHEISENGNYRITIQDNAGHNNTVVMYCYTGDVLQVNDGVLYRKVPDTCGKITFADLITGTHVDNALEEDESPYEVNPTRYDTYSLSDFNDIQKGDVMRLHYEFNKTHDTSVPPFTVSILTDTPDAVGVQTAIASTAGDIWDYYIEFSEDCSVSAIQVHFEVTDSFYVRQTENTLEFVDTFLMAMGNTWSSPATDTTTTEYVYMGGDYCAYNGLISTWINYPTDLDSEYTGTYTVTQLGDIHMVITAEAVRNVHKVYNRNWKYYVVGWRTSDGYIIQSPDDQVLNNEDTELYWPKGRRRSRVTVGELSNDACLVMFKGTLYLTLRGDIPNHYIRQINQRVSSFDIFTLDNDAKDFYSVKNYADRYPLQSGIESNKDATSAHSYSTGRWEFCFELGTNDAYLFDVQNVTSSVYKYSKDDVSDIRGLHMLGDVVTQAWEVDWENVPVENTTVSYTGCVVYNSSDVPYLTLDSNFDIYFSNKGVLHRNSWHNEESTYNTLGLGYDEAYSYDTSTWIKEKYVKFPFDVYVFGKLDDGTLCPGVTYEEYSSGILTKDVNGLQVKVDTYYVPAHTPIPLGWYQPTCASCSSDTELCNNQHWIDFSSDADGYKYYFWVCLSANEMKQGKVIFNSVNINCIPDAEEDNHAPLNNQDMYNRYGNAMRDDMCSIVGRVGNLTMVDTGDYRFSDTFKNPKDPTEWLVYELIKKLDTYKNTRGARSAQQNVILDPWDVRGILGKPALVTNFPGYQTYANSRMYNTYGTQWHKDGNSSTGIGSNHISALPLTGEFNIHDQLKTTLLKLGYRSTLTLDSIGNYYGSSGYFSTADETETDGLRESNANGDYGQYKVQVRPYYIAVSKDGSNAFLTDVYMRTPEGYQLINSGDIGHAGESLEVLNTSTYMYDSFNNTEDADTSARTYRLDQNLMRRMVTEPEAATTYSVVNDWRAVRAADSHAPENTLSMLSKDEDFARQLESYTNVDANAVDDYFVYSYGNSQYMFLRDRNRTFVGNNSAALRSEPTDATDLSIYKAHAQKWYFDLGLPASALFVKYDEPFDLDNCIRDDYYILECVDVYILGDVWTLHYDSPVSELGLTLPKDEPNNSSVSWDGSILSSSHLIPVTWYDPSTTTSKDDLDTEGTH